VTGRIALVGPAHPDTGGIAHFTAGLAPALAAGGVTVLTWTRRYPARFYPGTLRDTVSATAISYAAAIPVLDILNPLTWLKAVRRARRDGCRTLVVQWVHPVQGPVYRTMALAARRAGIGVVAICHNVSPHENSPLWSRFVRLGLRSADVLVVHSSPMAVEARRIHPRARVVEAFLPTFTNVSEALAGSTGADGAAVRARYGIAPDARLLLHFGFIRPYKGVEDAIRAMAHQTSGAHLLVVGECWDASDDYARLVAGAGVADRVTLDFRYVANDEMPGLFAAAEAVFLPYRSATQSAVVQLAYAFDRPVIATTVGGLPEAVAEGESGLLAPPEDPVALGAAIDRFYEADPSAWSAGVAAMRERFSWERYAGLIGEAAELARRR
jgi:glycosyltransferase involved in cell wall biosynthesis